MPMIGIGEPSSSDFPCGRLSSNSGKVPSLEGRDKFFSDKLGRSRIPRKQGVAASGLCPGRASAASREKAAGGIVSDDRARQEYGCAARHDGERAPGNLAVESEADQLGGVRERIQLADIVEKWARFLHAPERIERRGR